MQFRFGTDVIRISAPSRQAVLPQVRARLAERQGMTLATLTLGHLGRLRRNPAYRAAYMAQDLIVAEGKPIVWLSRLALRPLRPASAADLVLPLARAAAHAGADVALLGSAPGVLTKAADRLTQTITGLQIIAQLSPERGFDPNGPEADWLIDELADSEAGFCFLALDSPAQEVFAARARARLPGMAFASVGAGLDYVAGARTRAPRWMRRIGMDWLWDGIRAPLRMGPCYVGGLAVLPGAVWAALRMRQAGRPDTALRKAILGVPDDDTPRIPVKLERALVPLPARGTRPTSQRLLPILGTAPPRMLLNGKQ